MAKSKTTESKLARWFPYLLLIVGVVGIICSLILTYDQIQVWKDPNYTPSCSLNPIISCGSVIDSGQGDIFGIPAPFFGLLMFPVLATVGVAMLAGAKFKKWFWWLVQLGAIGGFAWALGLFLLSVFKIHALCPFCLTVDVFVYLFAWYATLYNIEQKLFVLHGVWDRIAVFSRKHHLDILVFWYVLIAAFILQHFWYYFGKHLPF